MYLFFLCRYKQKLKKDENPCITISPKDTTECSSVYSASQYSRNIDLVTPVQEVELVKADEFLSQRFAVREEIQAINTARMSVIWLLKKATQFETLRNHKGSVYKT